MSEEKKISEGLTVRHEKTLIEKYGMRIEIGERFEKRVGWEQRFELETGETLTLQQVDALKKSGKVDEGTIARVVWHETAPDWVGAQPIYTRLFDEEHFAEGGHVWFFGTSDGPIIATVGEGMYEEWNTLTDPAHVKYSNNGNIELLPIFGVARTMDIHISALKQRVALSPVMAEVYLQFVMQNRQFKYELRPVKPMAASMPLENNEEAPSVATA